MEAVVRVLPKADFSLELWFNTGDHRVFDVRPYLNKGDFTRLKDEALFRQAHVALDTVCWPGGLDIAPETLFDRSRPVADGEAVALNAAVLASAAVP
jgi:hypothetical protein